MDGVVADFDAYAEKMLGADKKINDVWPYEVWQQLLNNPRLYQDLEKTPEADDLVSYCRQYCKDKGYDLVFLTAVPKGNDVHWAFYDKVIWVQLRYMDIPVHFGPYSKDKQVHCKPGDILIDDRNSNIDEWRAAGGIAILHKGDLSNTISLLPK
jgi:hypothetical protein